MSRDHGDPRDLTFLRHKALDFTVPLVVKFKNCAQDFSPFCINSRKKNIGGARRSLSFGVTSDHRCFFLSESTIHFVLRPWEYCWSRKRWGDVAEGEISCAGMTSLVFQHGRVEKFKTVYFKKPQKEDGRHIHIARRGVLLYYLCIVLAYWGCSWLFCQCL